MVVLNFKAKQAVISI